MSTLPGNTCTAATDHLHLDPEFVARAAFFLSYAADRRAPEWVLAERFNIERNVALAVLREIGWKSGGANARS